MKGTVKLYVYYISVLAWDNIMEQDVKKKDVLILKMVLNVYYLVLQIHI